MKNNLTPDFKMFWDAYGLKRERIGAEHIWNRLSAAEKRAAIKGIEPYRRACREKGISMKYAQGYLSHHRWEDEPETKAPPVIIPAMTPALDRMDRW